MYRVAAQILAVPDERAFGMALDLVTGGAGGLANPQFCACAARVSEVYSIPRADPPYAHARRRSAGPAFRNVPRGLLRAV